MSETHVVTCFLRNRGEILLFRRSDEVGSYSGRWGAVAGHAEGDPDGTAREESGLGDAISFVRTGESFAVEDDLETRWVVHPYLFDCDSRAVETNYETAEFEWIVPTEIRRRETDPDLWKSYKRVAPTVETIEGDTDHGSAWLSVRALEVLRDRAGALATGGDDAESENESGWDGLAALAADLRAARPSMTVLENRINRAMAEASEDRTATAVERSTIAGIERAFSVDAAAAREAASLLDGPVVTLSRSGTVLDALRQVDESVIVAESRPAREGCGVAEALAAADHEVTLLIDAAVAHVFSARSIACVLVGADTVFPDSSVLNKVGTRGIAIAAAHEEVPVYAVAASDKISFAEDGDFEEGDKEAIYDGSEGIDVANPTFDRTPSELITVVTENGPLDEETVADRAEAFAALADRTQEPSSELD